MMRLLFAKVLPLALTGAFLQSSVSPIRPALNAFMAANSALSGQAVQNSGADFEEMLQQQLASAKGGIPQAAKAPPPASAKDQLNSIIAQVKGQNGDGAPPPKAARSAHAAKPARSAASSSTAEAPTPAPSGPEVRLTNVGR